MKRIHIAGLMLFLLMPLAAQAVPDASEPPASAQTADFNSGKKALAERNWQGAIEAFLRSLKNDPNNADAHNYLGYVYRHTNQLEPSFKHYHEALRINPNHRGAHNYIGWAYLLSNQPAKAEEHLAALEKLCGRDCDEYQDLSKGITAFKAKSK